MKKLLYAVIFFPSLAFAAGAGGINLTPDQKAILRSTNTWTAAQTFSSATFTTITVGSCNGCGGGGSGNAGIQDWLVDGSFIGPNQPGANPIKFKSLLIEGDMYVLNVYSTIDQ